MKTILLLLLSFSAHAQCSNYIKDSSFTVQETFVNVNPVRVQISDTALCSILTINQMNDYGTQPTQDGFTQSGAVFYTLKSASGSAVYPLSLSINNIKSTDYDCYKMYGFKYLYWKIAEILNLTITD